MGFFEGVTCRVAERIARRSFYVPSGIALTRAEAVAGALRRLVA
jgi:perosamine synthetase